MPPRFVPKASLEGRAFFAERQRCEIYPDRNREGCKRPSYFRSAFESPTRWEGNCIAQSKRSRVGLFEPAVCATHQEAARLSRGRCGSTKCFGPSKTYSNPQSVRTCRLLVSILIWAP